MSRRLSILFQLSYYWAVIFVWNNKWGVKKIDIRHTKMAERETQSGCLSNHESIDCRAECIGATISISMHLFFQQKPTLKTNYCQALWTEVLNCSALTRLESRLPILFFLFLSNSEKLKNQPICERRTNRIKREISVFTLNKL